MGTPGESIEMCATSPCFISAQGVILQLPVLQQPSPSRLISHFQTLNFLFKTFFASGAGRAELPQVEAARLCRPRMEEVGYQILQAPKTQGPSPGGEEDAPLMYNPSLGPFPA